MADLSGGELRRLQLALLVARGGNLLVFDEPTNHLDTESREALEQALDAYAGTIVLVSHDRALIDAVATRTLAIEGGTLVGRDGGWADLLQGRAAARAVGAAAPPAPPKQAARSAATDERPARGTKGGAGRRVRQLERRIQLLEAELAALDAALVDPATAGGHLRQSELSAQYRQLQEDISWALAEWEQAAEAAGV